MPYNLMDLLSDIAREAEVDRAAKWLEIAADDYPEILGIIRDNLDEPSQRVLFKITEKYHAFGGALIFIPFDKITSFIERLQAFYKEREAK